VRSLFDEISKTLILLFVFLCEYLSKIYQIDKKENKIL
jgi:hypothetical protein